MAPKSSSSRGGIQVRTVQRARSSASKSASNASSARSDRKSRPSARYRKALGRKNTHGGDFVKDDDAGRQFENRVLEVYAPADATNESTRKIPLRAQAELEGQSFRPPRLSLMCLNVISDNFDRYVLPLQHTGKDNSAAQSKIKQYAESRRKGLLGIGYAGYNEEQDKDFMPSDEEGESRMKRRKASSSAKPQSGKAVNEYLQLINSYNLELLAPQLTLQLQEMLERKSPQSLSFDVLSRFFLSPAKVAYSRTFRALAIVGGVPADEVVRMLKHLFVSPLTTPYSAPVIVKPNAATTLRSLHLQAFTRLSSRQLEPFFRETTSLEDVCLRGCVNVTSEAIAKLVESSGPTLRSVNVNWTSVGLAGVEHLVREAPHLTILKIAHVQGLSDVNVSAMMSRATQQTLGRGTVPLAKLRRLKVNGTQIGITGVASLLKHCGSHLESLDVGNTRVGGSGCIDLLFMALGYDEGVIKRSTQADMASNNINKTLRKINISSLEIPETELARFLVAIADFRALRTINVNYVQTRKGSTANGISDSMLEVLISSITERMKAMSDRTSDDEHLFDSISIATSSSLSAAYSPARLMIEAESKKIVRAMNLSGQNLSRQTSDIGEEGLYSVLVPLNVEVLILHGCKLPDQFDWRHVGVNGRLRSIDLSGTAVSKEMVDTLIEQNPCLEKIDLTGCRSIPVRSRRDYFRSMDAETEL